jgi:streptomycin 6-kinase
MANQSMTDTALGSAMVQWHLSRPTRVADSAGSIVYRVEQKSGQLAALKIYREAEADERRGTDLLNWYGGAGAAQVIAADEHAVLMEWIDGKRLSEPAMAGRDREATEAIGYLVQQLHGQRTAPPPAGLVPLKHWFAALFDSRSDAWPHTARDLYGRAKGIALALFDFPTDEVPLHADLHHDNILASSRGWVAIDPKGVLGEPTYEVACAFLNPWEARDLVIDQGRIGRMADSFSARLGLERKRVLAFAVAHAALSACWDLRDGKPVGHQIAVLPSLLTVWAQS